MGRFVLSEEMKEQARVPTTLLAYESGNGRQVVRFEGTTLDRTDAVRLLRNLAHQIEIKHD